MHSSEVLVSLVLVLSVFDVRSDPVAVIRIEDTERKNGTSGLKEFIIDVLRNSLKVVTELSLNNASSQRQMSKGNYFIVIMKNDTVDEDTPEVPLETRRDGEIQAASISVPDNRDLIDWQERASLRKEEIKSRTNNRLDIGLACGVIIFCVVHVMVVVGFRRFLQRKKKRRTLKFQKIFLDSVTSPEAASTNFTSVHLQQDQEVPRDGLLLQLS